MSTIKLSVDDPEFVEKIIYEVKSQGHFDFFRKVCQSDVDTQPAYQNLHSRVEDNVQKFLNRQVWTQETNKNKLREEMRNNIIRAGFLESGVTRIVDQIVDQKMESIQQKVEEILYKYVGIEKPGKKERHNGSLEVDTSNLLPTDLELEQVSPDSDKKSSLSEVKDEQIEEEIVEDEDFESPAFEPVEPAAEKNENSNLSAISGLTSQDSVENKSEPEVPQESQMSQEVEPAPLPPSEEAPPPPPEEPAEKSQFDLNKDSIEFTGTERKSMTLDDSTNSAEAEKEKVLQPQDVPVNSMEVDNLLYENDTTDSSEMRMEIDLKADDTQETAESSKVEESSQDSTVSKEKEKDKDKHRYHHKSSSSKDRHHHKSSRHHSSSSKSRHDDKHRSRSSKHKRSSGDKEKSSGDRERSTNEREKSTSEREKSTSEKEKSTSEREKSTSEREKSTSEREKSTGDKDKSYTEKSRTSSEKDRSSSSHKDRKSSSKNHKDDHHQEKSSSRKRRSTDRDSNEGKDQANPAGPSPKPEENSQKSQESKPDLSENSEASIDSKSAKKEKSSILVKYDYLKSKSRDEIDDGFCGFTDSPNKLPDNPWFECLRQEAGKSLEKTATEAKKVEGNIQQPRAKKQKSKSPDSTSASTNGGEETPSESKPQSSAQQQRYTSEDLFKPRFHFGNRSRRRGLVTEENAENVESTQ